MAENPTDKGLASRVEGAEVEARVAEWTVEKSDLKAAAGSFRAAVLSMVKCGEAWSPAMDAMADRLAIAIEREVHPVFFATRAKADSEATTTRDPNPELPDTENGGEE